MKQEKAKAEKLQRRATEARALSHNMRQFTMGFRAAFEEQLREQGLTLAQLRLLKAVNELQDVSLAALARRCEVTPQTLQAMLQRAVQARWITRGKSASNERIVTAAPTPLGLQLLATGMEKAAALEAMIWADTGLSELREMNAILAGAITRLGAAQS